MLTEALRDSLVISIAGGVLSVDRTAALQVMVSRPIVAAPVIGYLLGNAAAGLIVGVTLELLLIGDLPVGRYIPVHETGLSVLVTGITVTALGAMEGARGVLTDALLVLPLALVASIPVSRFHQKADEFTRRLNSRFFKEALAGVEAGGEGVMKANLKGTAAFFAVNTAAFFATALPVLLVSRALFPRVQAAALMLPAFGGCVLIGISAALYAVYSEKGLLIFSASGLASAFILVWLALLW